MHYNRLQGRFSGNCYKGISHLNNLLRWAHSVSQRFLCAACVNVHEFTSMGIGSRISRWEKLACPFLTTAHLEHFSWIAASNFKIALKFPWMVRTRNEIMERKKKKKGASCSIFYSVQGWWNELNHCCRQSGNRVAHYTLSSSKWESKATNRRAANHPAPLHAMKWMLGEKNI